MRLLGHVVLSALLGAGCSEDADGPAQSTPDGGGDARVEHDGGHRDVALDVPGPAKDYPQKLSETGLYKDIMNGVLADDVLAFTVRYPLWSDGAEKRRWLRIPAGQTVDTSDMDHWTFPVGTKAWKEFTRDGKRVETRLLEKRADGWRFIAYLWNTNGSDALAAPLGQKDAAGTAHDVPSQDDCQRCHLGGKDFLLGVGAIQLSAESGEGMLTTLAKKGLLSKPPTGEFSPPGEPAVREVLGYLHGNCGGCHQDVGVWADRRALRLHVRVGDTDPTKTPAYQTTIGVQMAHGDATGMFVGVVPGRPDESHLLFRMKSRDGVWEMPPVGTEKVDDVAVEKIRAWITSLSQ